MGSDGHSPQILVPYPGPSEDPDVQDIFLYLRPETNGVLVESVLLSVVKGCEEYRTGIKLIYLANFPGAYILDHHIVERHYAHKLFFAVHGKRGFTPKMRSVFQEHFKIDFEDAPIIGSFEALVDMGMTPEELFSSWVAPTDMVHVDGQSVKKINESYVVNYDIPALLHKNTRSTDIAVMLFRCQVDYDFFHDLVDEMQDALVAKSVLPATMPASRAFHYSKGPFEQLLDAEDYLCTREGVPIDTTELSFVRYAMTRGYTAQQLHDVVARPVGMFQESGGAMVEENIFTYTADDSYAEAIDKLGQLRAQLWIR